METTINDPSPFKILRTAQGIPDGVPSRRPMRRGISDLASRAQLSQAANERYLEALASLEVQHPLHHLIDPICRPTLWQGRRQRALRPWSPDDRLLLQTISGGEFALNGLRNRDLLAALYPDALGARRTELVPPPGSPASCACYEPMGSSAKWSHPPLSAHRERSCRSDGNPPVSHRYDGPTTTGCCLNPRQKTRFCGVMA